MFGGKGKNSINHDSAHQRVPFGDEDDVVDKSAKISLVKMVKIDVVNGAKLNVNAVPTESNVTASAVVGPVPTKLKVPTASAMMRPAPTEPSVSTASAVMRPVPTELNVTTASAVMRPVPTEPSVSTASAVMRPVPTEPSVTTASAVMRPVQTN